jgi:hypothetical protein
MKRPNLATCGQILPYTADLAPTWTDGTPVVDSSERITAGTVTRGVARIPPPNRGGGMERLPMHRAREILRLRWVLGLGGPAGRYELRGGP